MDNVLKQIACREMYGHDVAGLCFTCYRRLAVKNCPTIKDLEQQLEQRRKNALISLLKEKIEM